MTNRYAGYWSDGVFDDASTLEKNKPFGIFLDVLCTQPAVVYADRTKANTVDSHATDSSGMASAFLEPGTYFFKIIGSELVRQIEVYEDVDDTVDVSGLASAVSNETARASGAEAALQNNINNAAIESSGSAYAASRTYTDNQVVAASGLAVSTSQAALTTKAQRLTRTAVKAIDYTFAAGDLVPADTTSGNRTYTLPTAPADGTRCAVKHVIQGGINTISLVCGGSDVFNKASGSTTLTTPAQITTNFGWIAEYDAVTHIWTVVSDDLPLSMLDARYDAAGAANTALQTATGRAAALALVFGA